jgi:Fe-S oxidoreductase
MTLQLLTLRRSQELCELCPKLCRFACPVSEATSREALTPWGKVSLAALSGSAPEPSAALAFAGCTGCLRCTQHCAHENDVPTTLYAGRAAAVRAGTAPEVWREVAERFSIAGHAEDGDLAKAHRTLVAEGERAADRRTPGAGGDRAADRRTQAPAGAAPGGPLLYAGCDDLAAGARTARDALFAARALNAPLSPAPATALCCGLKLLEAGHPEEYTAHAARARAALLEAAPAKKPLHLVFLQPACARSVRERWPALPDGAVVEHIASYLARALAAVPERSRPPPLPQINGEVVFHDPCELARGLFELTAPRALLAAALEGGSREASRCGVETSCCGAGGLLPRTLPEVFARLAAARAAELGSAGAPVATASPACAAALGAEDVVSIVARWLARPRGERPSGGEAP